MDRPTMGTDDVNVDDVARSRSGDAPTGVRRVNNMPLVIIGAVLAVFVVLVTLVSLQRGEKKEAEPMEAIASLPENSQILDQMLAHGGEGGLVPDPDEGMVPSFQVARLEDGDVPPLPADVSNASASGDGGDSSSGERMKLFQSAMHARSAVARLPSSAPPGGQTAPPEREEADTKQKESHEEPTPEIDERIPVHADGSYARFDRTAANGRASSGDRWHLDSSVEAPRTRYEVRAGSVIPAVMISGINAELPGQIIAQVSQDVFDTPTGKYRLIPQGSRLVGRYNHNIVRGQSRILVAWQRIVFPDGKAIDIGAMDGVDGAGYAGFTDEVDNHYLRVFGSAILLSGITSGLTSSRVDPGNDPFGSSNAAILSQSLAQQLGQVATKMIEKNLDIAPGLKIRPGYRFNVMAIKDLPFDAPYQAFAY